MLVLDLDETLIHATETPLDHPPDFLVEGYAVYRRPHLADFLEACADCFDLAVWSSASDDYVEAVVDAIFPDRSHLHFVWGRSRASLRRFIGYDEPRWEFDHRHYRKPLVKAKKRGWPLERILIVDDTPEKCVQNYGNAIYIQPFEGDSDDAELPLLAAYLKTLCDHPNVRTIEKRGWRAAAIDLAARTSGAGR